MPTTVEEWRTAFRKLEKHLEEYGFDAEREVLRGIHRETEEILGKIHEVTTVPNEATRPYDEALAALEKLATALRDIRDDFAGDIKKCEADWAKPYSSKPSMALQDCLGPKPRDTRRPVHGFWDGINEPPFLEKYRIMDLSHLTKEQSDKISRRYKEDSAHKGKKTDAEWMSGQEDV